MGEFNVMKYILSSEKPIHSAQSSKNQNCFETKTKKLIIKLIWKNEKGNSEKELIGNKSTRLLVRIKLTITKTV